MELTKELCLKIKEDRRKKLRLLPIDEKIKRVEELRKRVETIRELRYKKISRLRMKKMADGIKV